MDRVRSTETAAGSLGARDAEATREARAPMDARNHGLNPIGGLCKDRALDAFAVVLCRPHSYE
eukprot:15441531-Alexandrium_andersonii.AAC.1